jgi:CubicO group peptidase (beta-lactamase class C family)
MVAAHLINTYSGHLVPEFVGQHIFKALNMSSTTLDYATALSSGHLSQAFDENGRRVPNLLEDFVELGRGPGGIISNAVDLSKWLMYLLHASDDDVNRKLPWEVLSKTWEPYTFVKPPAPAPFNGTITYGTGWFQGNYWGYEVRPVS